MRNDGSYILSSKYALDVSSLFAETVELYTSFSQDILQLIADISVFSPQQIADRCGSLVDTKQVLAGFDQQIIDILDAAGEDIVGEPMVHDYRLALAHATHASNNLYQHLQAQKVILQEISLNALF